MERIIVLLLKFGVVGFSGTLLDFFITWVCKERLRWNKFLSNSLGFIVAASSNYVLNRLWTFQSDASDISREYATFMGISMIGLLLNNLFLYIFNERVSLNFYISKVIAVVLVTIWNFLGNYFFTF